jgi:hypothetical protein
VVVTCATEKTWVNATERATPKNPNRTSDRTQTRILVGISR